jgi:hypothetical protein
MTQIYQTNKKKYDFRLEFSNHPAGFGILESSRMGEYEYTQGFI